MKKRYTFLPKNWFRFSLITVITATLSLNLKAQTAPATQWDKTFGGIDEEDYPTALQTTDGGFIFGGWSESGANGDKSQPGKGGKDYWVVKVDANGNKSWDKTIGSNGDDVLFTLKQTSDGGYILGGHSNSGISGDKSQASRGVTDYWVVKLDGSGNKVWDKTFGGDWHDQLSSLSQTSDGGFILGGMSMSGVSGEKSQPCQTVWDYWIVKLDGSGNKVWDKTFGGNGNDNLPTIFQTSDGGYIVGGSSESGISGDKTLASKGSWDYWILKLDSLGNKSWEKVYGGNNQDWAYSLQQTIDGGYIIGGQSISGMSGDKTQGSRGSWDYWVLKLDSNGNKIWDKTFGGNDYDGLNSLQQTSDGGYILGGWSGSGISNEKSEICQGLWDYWIVKLDANGNKLWDKTYGGSGQDLLWTIKQSTDGGYILGGWSDSGINGDKTQAAKGETDFWIVKLGPEVTGIKDAETTFALSISPNPNQGKFTLQLSNLTAPKAEVSVSDLLGRVVLQQQLNVSNNQISEELTLPNAKGMYLLQVKVGEQLLTRKIMVE